MVGRFICNRIWLNSMTLCLNKMIDYHPALYMFCNGLRSDIKLVMLLYIMKSINGAFHLAIGMEWSLTVVKPCPNCKGYGNYDYLFLLKSWHIDIVSINNLDDLRVVEVVYVLFTSTSEINALLKSSTSIFWSKYLLRVFMVLSMH